MDTGGFTLRFRSAADARQAAGTVVDVVQARAQSINIWGGNDAKGSWASELVRREAMLSVPDESPICDLEYGICDTPQGDTLFQRICVLQARLHPRASFAGSCCYHSCGSVVRACGPNGMSDEAARTSPVEQTVEVTYDGCQLGFEVTLAVHHPDGCDQTVQRQVWERNDHGYFERRAVEVPRFCALYDIVSMRLLRAPRPENPYRANMPYLSHVFAARDRGDLRCVGQTQEGSAYGCTFVSTAMGVDGEGDRGESHLPAVCLVDSRGRELWIASTPETWRGPSELPTWVHASPNAELLLWEVSGFMYLWDGLRVRKVVR